MQFLVEKYLYHSILPTTYKKIQVIIKDYRLKAEGKGSFTFSEGFAAKSMKSILFILRIFLLVAREIVNFFKKE